MLCSCNEVFVAYLCYARVGPFEPGLHTLRRFIRELDTGLQQIDWKLLVNFRCDPSSIRVVDTLCVRDLRTQITSYTQIVAAIQPLFGQIFLVNVEGFAKNFYYFIYEMAFSDQSPAGCFVERFFRGKPKL